MLSYSFRRQLSPTVWRFMDTNNFTKEIIHVKGMDNNLQKLRSKGICI